MSGLDSKKLPRTRIELPANFRAQVESSNPLNRDGWVCFEADCHVIQRAGRPEGVEQNLPFVGHCPVCLKEASLCCGKCKSVYYCSKPCQTRHWKQSHKAACQVNPKLYRINTDLNQFRGLDKQYFEGHEFITIKPTNELANLAQICETALEGADDIFDIRGFGTDQIDASWVANNSSHDIARAVQQRFGWTSGAYQIEPFVGYRFAENKLVYMVLFDDCFQNPVMSPGLEPSYYGAGCFALPVDSVCRGNVVIFRLMLKKKAWNPKPREAGFIFQLTDDSNLRFEYELYPITRAEIAHLLLERTKAMQQGAFSRRMWRSHIRRAERNVLLQKESSTPTYAF